MILPLNLPWCPTLCLLRSPITSPALGGNKYLKLAGYLNAARRKSVFHLITMSGAHSNHLRAFTALAKAKQWQATAIIRGDELADAGRQSEEIRSAREGGVRCIFISRTDYRRLRDAAPEARPGIVPGINFAAAVFIPEGGLGAEGVQGVARWARAARGFDTVFLPCATGTTAAGFLQATKSPTRVAGVAVLRNETQIEETIRRFAPAAQGRFELIKTYAGLFGKEDGAIGSFAADFSARWGIRIDSVYMAKALLAVKDAAETGRLSGRTLLVYTYNE